MEIYWEDPILLVTLLLSLSLSLAEGAIVMGCLKYIRFFQLLTLPPGILNDRSTLMSLPSERWKMEQHKSHERLTY